MLRWSEEQLREHHAKRQGRAAAMAEAKDHQADQPRPKYRNKRCEIQGEKFDSKAEASRFIALKRMEEAGIIKDLRRQVSFEVVPACGKERPVRYVADFTFHQDGKLIVEDVKSRATKTREYIIKRKLMLFVHGIKVSEFIK